MKICEKEGWKFCNSDNGGWGSWTKTCEWLLEAEQSPQLTASKEMETLVLQPQGTKLCQQPKWTSEQFSLRAFRKEPSPADSLNLA